MGFRDTAASLFSCFHFIPGSMAGTTNLELSFVDAQAPYASAAFHRLFSIHASIFGEPRPIDPKFSLQTGFFDHRDRYVARLFMEPGRNNLCNAPILYFERRVPPLRRGGVEDSLKAGLLHYFFTLNTVGAL